MSSPTPVIIIGAATALMDIIDLVAAINAAKPTFKIVGALDDNTALHGTSIEGVPVLGGLALAKEQKDVSFVFAICSYRSRIARIALFESLGVPREKFVNLIHPAAEISPMASIGHGGAFYGGISVGPKVQIGDFAVLYSHAIVSPYARIGNFAMIAPGGFVGARVWLGAGAFIGAVATVAEAVRVGPGGMIGTASAAYRGVKPGYFVLGAPAKPVTSIPVPAHLVAAWEEAMQKEPVA